MATHTVPSLARLGLVSTRARCIRESCGARARASRGHAAAAATAPETRITPGETSTSRGWCDDELEALRGHYASEGWVVVRGLITADEVHDLQLATDALQAEVAHITRSVRDRGVFFEVQSQSGRKGEPAVAPGVLRKITSPSKRSPAFASLAHHPNVRSVCAQLCGVSGAEGHDVSGHEPTMRCVVDQVNLKHPKVGTGFPWHQDVSFLKRDARRAFESHGGCNAVVALDHSHERNGGFTVLGGTHLCGERWSDLR